MDNMNITAAQYIRDFEGNNALIRATIDGDLLYVPLDEGNGHYAEILRQVATGTLIIAYAA
jgi:hypothetical protein